MTETMELLEGYLPADGRTRWNQSFYFNAFDPESRLGCVIRAGFLEGAGTANSWMVIFREGKPLFMRFNNDLPCPTGRLAGGVRIGGMTLTALDPLKAARIFFHHPDLSFDLTWTALHPLIDAVAFGAGGGGTESFATSLAHAHLEGSCRVSGEIRLRDGAVAFNGTGGRDIAAGERDWGRMEHYRVAWPIFEDDTAIIGIHGVSGGKSSYMSMIHDGEAYTRMRSTRDRLTFTGDELTVAETRWDFDDEKGRAWSFEGRPLFRCFLPADNYVLAEHIATFVRQDGARGYGLIECGFRLS